jgi:hypothetical protein
VPLLRLLVASCRHLRLIWADGAYASKAVSWTQAGVKITNRQPPRRTG